MLCLNLNFLKGRYEVLNVMCRGGPVFSKTYQVEKGENRKDIKT